MGKKLYVIVSIFLLIACERSGQEEEISKKQNLNRKVLIVHSYHSTSKRVMEHNESIIRIFKENEIDYDFFYMDTQRNKELDYIKEVALKAKQKINEYKPEVIITFDDNAFKFVIMEYYKDSDFNVIFAGLDWDISQYNAPYSNTTGMISVTLMENLIESLKKYSRGNKVAWLGYNTLTSQKETDAYLNVLGLEMDVYFVETLEEWKNEFLKIQDNYDILIHSGTLTSIKGWSENESNNFVSSNIKIPIGTVNKSIMSCSILGLVVVPTEQGVWVANKAKEIIHGADIKEIPVTNNKEGDIYINLDLAEKLDIILDNKIIKNATIFKIDENN